MISVFRVICGSLIGVVVSVADCYPKGAGLDSRVMIFALEHNGNTSSKVGIFGHCTVKTDFLVFVILFLVNTKIASDQYGKCI
jgi:hypothetical protein